jgi:hypothetical protein
MSIIDEIWVIHLQKVDTLLMIGIKKNDTSPQNFDHEFISDLASIISENYNDKLHNY